MHAVVTVPFSTFLCAEGDSPRAVKGGKNSGSYIFGGEFNLNYFSAIIDSKFVSFLIHCVWFDNERDISSVTTIDIC